MVISAHQHVVVHVEHYVAMDVKLTVIQDVKHLAVGKHAINLVLRIVYIPAQVQI